jgi:hypothetical protein
MFFMANFCFNFSLGTDAEVPQRRVMQIRVAPQLRFALALSFAILGYAPQASSQIFPFVSASPLLGSTSTGGAVPARSMGIFSRVAADAYVGTGGIGLDISTRVSERWNLRVGSELWNASTSLVEEQADVTAHLQLRSGHASLDWFPFRNSFRVSPRLNFANNNQLRATALVPPGSTITLGGSDYISSDTDPLHGSGSVDFRKVAPGLTAGFGNAIPRSGKHFSFPFEFGFYYVGQPGFKVSFTGSACDPTQPAGSGCQSVDTDAEFQQSLTEFRARMNHNLSYASFFPVLSSGIGYRF